MGDQIIDILLVEDSEDDSAFFKHSLTEAMPATQLRILRDGAEALDVIFGTDRAQRSAHIAQAKVIVLDLMLPKISGFEVLRKLKSDEHLKTIPVVILSSSREERDLIEAYQLGANSYLVKPMDFDEFAALVKEIATYWLRLNHTPQL